MQQFNPEMQTHTHLANTQLDNGLCTLPCLFNHTHCLFLNTCKRLSPLMSFCASSLTVIIVQVLCRNSCSADNLNSKIVLFQQLHTLGLSWSKLPAEVSNPVTIECFLWFFMFYSVTFSQLPQKTYFSFNSLSHSLKIATLLKQTVSYVCFLKQKAKHQKSKEEVKTTLCPKILIYVTWKQSRITFHCKGRAVCTIWWYFLSQTLQLIKKLLHVTLTYFIVKLLSLLEKASIYKKLMRVKKGDKSSSYHKT